jgi:TPR repeat protein
MDAHYWLGNSYYMGDNNVVKNIKRALHHWGQAAILGDVSSRFSLGNHEAKVTGNMKRAVKHWSIAASAGQKKALDDLKELYMKGYMTKAEFEIVLRAHKDSADGMYSEQRSIASTFDNGRFRSKDGGMYRDQGSGGTCNCVDCMMGRNA